MIFLYFILFFYQALLLLLPICPRSTLMPGTELCSGGWDKDYTQYSHCVCINPSTDHCLCVLQMEAKVVMAMLLQRFDFTLVPGQTFDIEDTGTLRPKSGVVCTIKHRKYKN